MLGHKAGIAGNGQVAHMSSTCSTEAAYGCEIWIWGLIYGLLHRGLSSKGKQSCLGLGLGCLVCAKVVCAQNMDQNLLLLDDDLDTWLLRCLDAYLIVHGFMFMCSCLNSSQFSVLLLHYRVENGCNKEV
jgi:hypothetical protein